MAVVKDETLPVRIRGRRRPRPPGRAGSGRSSWASAWSTRPRSSPRPASWRATRSIYGGGGTVRLEALDDGRAARAAPDLRGPGPGHRRHRAGAEGRLHDRQRPRARASAAPSGWSNEFEIDSRPGEGTRVIDRAMEVTPRADAVVRGRPTPARSARRAAPPAALAAARSASTRPTPARVALVVTEAATNLVKHAGGGELLARRRSTRGGRAASRCSRSTAGRASPTSAAACATAISTAGTPGTGLGAIAPLADGFDIYSVPGHGHRAAAPASGRGAAGTRRAGLDVGRRLRARSPAKTVCGDGWAVRRRDRRASSWSSTGSATGRWPPTRRARPPSRSSAQRRPGAGARSSQAMHAALRSTRGAAVAVARDRPRQRQWSASPASATSPGRSWTPAASRSMVSHNGTAGHDARKIQEFTYPWPPGALLVMHSDGLATRWTLDAYPGLAARDPGAGRRRALPRLHSRGRDDATVVVVRSGGGRDEPAPARPWRSATSTTSCSRASARGRSRRCSASTPRTRRASPPPSPRSPATPSSTPAAGEVEFRVEGRRRPSCSWSASATAGPGIARPAGDPGRPLPLADRHGRSGIVGARRLMDRFDDRVDARRGHDGHAEEAPARAARRSSRRATWRGSPSELARATRRQTRSRRSSSRTRSCCARSRSCGRRQDELARLNRELEDTNRGVVALYAELDEKADHLRRADEMKSRFLSNMSHEFRTPLNSILALVAAPARPHRRRADRRAGEAGRLHPQGGRGPVGAGQRPARPRQGRGGQDRRPAASSSTSADLFGALRGMLRPLLVERRRCAWSSRSRRSCRRCTPTRGRSRRSCATSSPTRSSSPSAARCGSRAALGRRRHGRLRGRRHRHRHRARGPGADLPGVHAGRRARCSGACKGTGLGLPLSRKLAELLGGRVSVRERARRRLDLLARPFPRIYRAPRTRPTPRRRRGGRSRRAGPVLVVEDKPRDAALYEKYLKGSGFQVVPARTTARGAPARSRPRSGRGDRARHPARGEDTWTLPGRAEARRGDPRHPGPGGDAPSTTSARALALGADAYCVEAGGAATGCSTTLQRGDRAASLRDGCSSSTTTRSRATSSSGCARRPALSTSRRGGRRRARGCACARDDRPDAIFLDLDMPDLSGRSRCWSACVRSPAPASIPVIVVTSKVLDDAERQPAARASAPPSCRRRRSVPAAVRAAPTALAVPACERHDGAASELSDPQRRRLRARPLRPQPSAARLRLRGPSRRRRAPRR